MSLGLISEGNEPNIICPLTNVQRAFIMDKVLTSWTCKDQEGEHRSLTIEEPASGNKKRNHHINESFLVSFPSHIGYFILPY